MFTRHQTSVTNKVENQRIRGVRARRSSLTSMTKENSVKELRVRWTLKDSRRETFASNESAGIKVETSR